MVEVINASQLTANAYNNLTSSLGDVFSPIMPILKAVGIAFLIYLIFLIIRAIINIKNSRRIKKIAEDVKEINAKLDLLVKKEKKKK